MSRCSCSTRVGLKRAVAGNKALEALNNILEKAHSEASTAVRGKEKSNLNSYERASKTYLARKVEEETGQTKQIQ